MMRRLRLSAACPRNATRTRMTGFNLFTHEMQKQRQVLGSKNLKEGTKNMQVMSKLWTNLTPRRREVYNERARQRDALLLSDSTKKNNTFNLLMRLFGEEKILLNAGDEAFTALIAKSTMQAMKAKDTRKLRARLQVTDTSSAKGKPPVAITSAFKRFSNPHMMFFNSFTEMQHSVAPTRQNAFAATSKLVSLSNVSESGEEYAIQNFASLSAEESNLFAPISDLEAPYFEVFCATRCGNLDYRHFNILQLFTAFRGIDVEAPQNAERERLYRSLLSSDRSHDGAYFRARRCLERLEAPRSSDCGLYITKSTDAPVRVPPSTYGLESSWDEVAVAAMLAETREALSVYDDVLVRAALLRSDEKNAQLELYQVRLDAKAVVRASLTEEVPVKAAAKSTRATAETLVAAAAAEDVEEEEAEVVVLVKPSRAQKTKRQKVAKKTAVRTVTATRPTRTEGETFTADAAREKEETEENEAAADFEDVAAPRRSSAKKAREASSSPSSVEAEFGAEEFLASEEGEAMEEAEDVAATADEASSVEADEVVAAAAPAKERKTAKGRTARSQLTDPTSMLPAKARVQKLITKHASTRKKVQLLSTKPQPSPYVPPGRNASFTESIRAMLSSSA